MWELISGRVLILQLPTVICRWVPLRTVTTYLSREQTKHKPCAKRRTDVLRRVTSAVNVCGNGDTEGLWMGSPTVPLHPSFYQIGIASISLSKREIRFYISKKKKIIPDHDAW